MRGKRYNCEGMSVGRREEISVFSTCVVGPFPRSNSTDPSIQQSAMK